MTQHKVSIKFILAVACCAIIVLAPFAASAQGVGGVVQGTKHGIQKGAEGVQKGAEDVYGKTKQGAEDVGRGAKKAITGDENTSDQDIQKGSQTNTEVQRKGTPTERTTKGVTGEKNLPKTAGELPLLAIVGAACLAAAMARRRRASSNS